MSSQSSGSTADDVLKEVENLDIESALAPQQGSRGIASTAQNFCKNYPTQIRPLLLGVTGILKLFHRGDAANAIAQAVAFMDVTCGGDGGGGTGSGGGTGGGGTGGGN